MNPLFIKAQKMIAQYKENISFIKSRIKIQQQPGYNPIMPYTQHTERQYSSFDIWMEYRKMVTIKRRLKQLS